MKPSPLLSIVLALLASVGAPAAESVPDFVLERVGGGSPVRLFDHAGKVVVLDFFAHWCVPCARSSPVVEEQIQKYYQARQGNARGVPVQVLSVNVEADDPSRTAAFVRKHGVSLAVNDQDGRTLQSFGGKGLPFFVVLDGTRGTPEKPSFQVVYARPGFEGAEKLRRLIDSLGATKP